MANFNQTGQTVHGGQYNISGTFTDTEPPRQQSPAGPDPMMRLEHLRIGLAEFFGASASADFALQHLTHLATGIGEPTDIARDSRNAGEFLNHRAEAGHTSFTTLLADDLFYRGFPHLAGAVATMPDERKTALNHFYADVIHRTASNVDARARDLLDLHMHATYLHELNATGDPRVGKEMVEFATRRSSELDRSISKTWMDYYLTAQPDLPHSPPLSEAAFELETERIWLLYDATVPELLAAGETANRERDAQRLLAVLEGLEARQPDQPGWAEAAEKVRTIVGDSMVAVADLNLDEPFQFAPRHGHPADLAAERRATTTTLPTTTTAPEHATPDNPHIRHR